MRRVFIVLTFILGCFLSSPALAGLEWEAHRINHTASVTDDKAEATFKFTNTGDQPVTITSIKTSCGCTTATLDKKTYAPGVPGTPGSLGESGEITAIFAFGDRTGRQHKRITVRTSEPGEGDDLIMDETALYLRVTIPQPVKVRPRLVYWKPGEDHASKSVRVTIQHDEPVSITKVEVHGYAVSAEMKMIEAGKSYEVIITPMSADKMAELIRAQEEIEEASDALSPTQPISQSTVRITAEFAEGLSRTYTVRARVMNRPAIVETKSANEPAVETATATQPSSQDTSSPDNSSATDRP